MTSIIILTYNSEKHIVRLLESIYENNKDEEFEIILVDNNSTDKTLELTAKIQDPKPKIQIVANKENFGFAKGINIGATNAKGDYLLFVNPDTEWEAGSIADLEKVFETQQKVGIVGGKLVNSSNKPERSAGKFLGFWACYLMAYSLDEIFKIRFSPNKTSKVDFVSGGFMMVKKELFEKLHGFDEKLFMYVEDMELCFRAGKLGFSTYFTPDVSLKHEAHGSSSKGFAIKNIYKGIFYFQKKHNNFISYLLVRILFWNKALALVIVGKILNNKNLSDTYRNALSSF